GAGLLALSAAAPATAGGWTRQGYGIYSPAEPPVRGRTRLYRYDPGPGTTASPAITPTTAPATGCPARKCAIATATGILDRNTAISRPGATVGARHGAAATDRGYAARQPSLAAVTDLAQRSARSPFRPATQIRLGLRAACQRGRGLSVL